MSPWVAASSSLVCFAIGAVIPLLTYLLGFDSLAAALMVGGAGLFAAGAIVARFTGRGWAISGLRQLVLGGLAAGVTYLIGMLLA